MGYIRFFFTQTGLFTTLYHTLIIKKKIYKISFKFLFTKFHSNSVNNEVLGQKLEGGAKRPTPHRLFRVKIYFSIVGALKPWNTDWDKNQERTEPTLFNLTLEFNIVSH